MINDWIVGGILTIVFAEILWLVFVSSFLSLYHREWKDTYTSTKYFTKFFIIVVGACISVGMVRYGLYKSMLLVSAVYLVCLFIYLNVKLADWLCSKKSKGRCKQK
jgi:uncharacterized membrane protein YhaH (DUF805 family)